MLSRIQDAASNSGVPDIGPFTPGRAGGETPQPPAVDVSRRQAFADRWAQGAGFRAPADRIAGRAPGHEDARRRPRVTGFRRNSPASVLAYRTAPAPST